MNFKFLAMTLILTLSPSMSYPSETNWVSGADEVGNTLKEGQALYEAGNMQGAKGKVTDAYFEVFEGKGMETAVRRFISLRKATELEKGFADIRKAIHGGVPAGKIKEQTLSLIEALKSAANELDRKGVGMDVSY